MSYRELIVELAREHAEELSDALLELGALLLETDDGLAVLLVLGAECLEVFAPAGLIAVSLQDLQGSINLTLPRFGLVLLMLGASLFLVRLPRRYRFVSCRHGATS